MKIIRESRPLRDLAPRLDSTVVNTYWDEFRTKWHTLLIAEKNREHDSRRPRR